MKKSLIALAVLGAFAGTAHAADQNQPADTTNVSLYGILDVGVAQMTNAGNFSNFVTGAVPTGNYNSARIGTVRGMMNGGESQSRWGIKGSEDLGGGYKAFFQMESAFSLGNGQLATSGLAGGANNPGMIADTSLNGQLFNRMALVGISSENMGAFSFGRQYDLALDIITSTGGGYDPVNAQMFSPINFSGFYGGGGETDNARVDNAIKYAKSFGKINVNALYGMGGVATHTSARSNTQLNVGYEGDQFGVEAVALHASDTTAISPAAGAYNVSAQFVNLDSEMLAARVQVAEPVTLKAGYERIKISAPSNYNADSQMTTIYGYQITGNSAFVGQKIVNVFWVGANIVTSEASKLSLGIYDAKTPAYTGSGVQPTPANGAAAGSTGDDRYYSIMWEYNLSKKTNFYLAAMKDHKSGALLVATSGPGSLTDFNTYGAGLRVKF